MRTGLRAITAFCTAFEEHIFIDSTGRPQPILAYDRRCLLGNHLSMFGEFVGGFRDGEDRVFEKITPPVFRIGSHRIA